MEWHRIRKAATKLEITLARIDLPAYIKTSMARAALAAGADPVNDRFVYLQRSGDWYVTFGLDVNPPDYAVEKLRVRGWEPMP